MGDRYVAEKMREAAINVGGEQSGHMILSDFATTGDGLVAALQVLACWSSRGGRPARCAACSRRCRKCCATCASPAPRRCDDARVQQAIRAAEGRLNGAGRLLIRQSGTETLIRVMAEAEDEALVAQRGGRAMCHDRGAGACRRRLMPVA